MDVSIIAVRAEPLVGRLRRQIMIVSDWPQKYEWNGQVKGHYSFTAPSLCYGGGVVDSFLGMAPGFLPLSVHSSRDCASHAIGVLECLYHEVTISETSLCPPDDVCRILLPEHGIRHKAMLSADPRGLMLDVLS